MASSGTSPPTMESAFDGKTVVVLRIGRGIGPCGALARGSRFLMPLASLGDQTPGAFNWTVVCHEPTGHTHGMLLLIRVE
jgi:hypothetical protein